MMFTTRRIYVYLIVCSCTLLYGCNSKSKLNVSENSQNQSITANGLNHFYVGTYTEGTESEGIYQYVINSDGFFENKGLKAIVKNPSFLAKNENETALISVNELNPNGTISSFEISKDTLQFVNKISSAGSDPCYIAISNDQELLVSNYSSGTIGLFELSSNHELNGPIDILTQEDVNGNRKSHAHAAIFSKQNSQVISVNLGLDAVWFTQLKNEHFTKDDYRISFEDGSGPRHILVHSNHKWIYVINELNSTISLLTKEKMGKFGIKHSFSTLPKHTEIENFGAEIHLSKDGRFLYASNRGHNSITVYGIDPVTGFLDFLQNISTGGDWPRNFSLTPDELFVVVANQKSNNLVSFSRDVISGELKQIASIQSFSPAFILF